MIPMPFVADALTVNGRRHVAPLVAVCSDCDGLGVVETADDRPEVCAECDGRGDVVL